jgi:two-component system, chemotaxis family, chemotaxis protein CheY
MRILVVDDDPISCMFLENIMSSFGDCEAVSSGADAISAFKNAWDQWAPFKLIMLDISMPVMDGTETLFAIRQTEIAKNVPAEDRVKIVMVTARSDKSTVTTSVQAGCDGYVIKPFDWEIIKNMMDKVWSNVAATI